MAYQKIKGVMSDGETSRFIQVDEEGRVVISPRGIGNIKTVSVTKPLAAAGDYAAEDVLCENATTGTAWKFQRVVRKNGASGRITKAHIMWNTTALTPRITLYLFLQVPTGELRDNVGNTSPTTADKGIYLDKIDFPALEDLGGMSESLVTPSTYGNLPIDFTCFHNCKDLDGIAVLRNAVTGEAAGAEMTIRLTIEQY